jgi:biotin transport system substrate-specific component
LWRAGFFAPTALETADARVATIAGMWTPRPQTAVASIPRSSGRADALRDMLAASSFALLTSLAAQVHIPMPPDGVPMTLQTLAVLCAALCLGPRLGSISMLIYLAIGVVGGAVFAQGDKGFGVILGQTGGYLIGFVLSQPVVGAIARRRDGSTRGWLAMITAVVAGSAVIFAIGVPWLAVCNGFGLGRALEGGLYPFIPGLVVKSIAAVAIGRLAAPLASKRPW